MTKQSNVTYYCLFTALMIDYERSGRFTQILTISDAFLSSVGEYLKTKAL